MSILEDIRLAVSDGLGCLHDVMNDEDCCNLPFWNTLWDLKRRPSSSLGIIFDHAASHAPGGAVRIHGVIPGSPADVMGQLKGGDAVLAVDSCVVDARDAAHRLRGHDMIGTLCDVLVRRPSGETLEVQLQRTSAAHTFALGQLADLLAAHDALLIAPAPARELLASAQAVRLQLLDMERLRLTRESFLAAKFHSIQARVFDSTIAALSSLRVEPAGRTVPAPAPDAARGEQRVGPQPGPAAPADELEPQAEDSDDSYAAAAAAEEEEAEACARAALELEVQGLRAEVMRLRFAVAALAVEREHVRLGLQRASRGLADAALFAERCQRGLELAAAAAAADATAASRDREAIAERRVEEGHLAAAELRARNAALSESVSALTFEGLTLQERARSARAELAAASVAVAEAAAERDRLRAQCGGYLETISLLRATNQSLAAAAADGRRRDDEVAAAEAAAAEAAEAVVLAEHERASLQTKAAAAERERASAEREQNRLGRLLSVAEAAVERARSERDAAVAERDVAERRALRAEARATTAMAVDAAAGGAGDWASRRPMAMVSAAADGALEREGLGGKVSEQERGVVGLELEAGPPYRVLRCERGLQLIEFTATL